MTQVESRLRYLLGLSADPIESPVSVTGGPDWIQSYGLLIGERCSGSNAWWVYSGLDHGITRAHVAALRAVLADAGYLLHIGGDREESCRTMVERDITERVRL